MNESLIQTELRNKWKEIPSTRMGRIESKELLKMSDSELLSYWNVCKDELNVPEVRGWYQELYKESFTGKKIADVGPGIGLDGIFFAENGASVTFVDIVQSNLDVIERVCNLKGITASFYFVDDFFKYNFEHNFDVFMFIGSMHNTPFEFSKKQVSALMQYLNKDGKVMMLAYPKSRYEDSGAKDFKEFGKMTDGDRTPWCEWYDSKKIKQLFGKNFQLIFSKDFGKNNREFNWFELQSIIK